jgi:hypothetical protein
VSDPGLTLLIQDIPGFEQVQIVQKKEEKYCLKLLKGKNLPHRKVGEISFYYF